MYIDFKDPTKVGRVQNSSNDEPLLPPVDNTIKDEFTTPKKEEIKQESIDINDTIDLNDILNLDTNTESKDEQKKSKQTQTNDDSLDIIPLNDSNKDDSSAKEEIKLKQVDSKEAPSLIDEINAIKSDEIISLDNSKEEDNSTKRVDNLDDNNLVSLIDEIKSIKADNAVSIDNTKKIEDNSINRVDNSSDNSLVSLDDEIKSIKSNEAEDTININSDTSFSKESKTLDPEDNILNKIQKVLQEKQKKNESEELNLEDSSLNRQNRLLNETPINEEPKRPNNPNLLNSGFAKFEPFEFRGKAGEFFKIWIVNVALTIITLGIYSAWAKVRNNRYIYANTYLHNSNFEYNANPKKILIGRAIVVTFYALFFISSRYLGLDTLSAALAVIFLALFPYLVRQAINFNLKSTSYRNIPFKFHAKIRSFYYLALLGVLAIIALPAAMAIALKYMPQFALIISIAGLIYYIILFFTILPILYKRYKDLVINNASYGNSRFVFSATNKEAISVFSKIAMLTFLVSLIYGGVTYSLKYLRPLIENNPYIHDPIVIGYIIYFVVAIVYLFFTGFFKGISDGYLSNFVRNHTTLDGAEFKGEIKPLKLGFISATNAVMLLLSLGLLYPWTKFRYLKYKMKNSYVKCSNYDKFSSSGYEKTNAIGEETMDFFDIDIGF